MKHEDGYCDKCGAEVDVLWLNMFGEALCETCALTAAERVGYIARKPEARDDGR